MVASLQILFIKIKMGGGGGGGVLIYSTAAIVNFSLKEVKTRKRPQEIPADLGCGLWTVGLVFDHFPALLNLPSLYTMPIAR